MIRFSVCIEMIFNQLPFLDRMKKVAGLGLPAIEFWSWQNKDISAIATTKGKLKINVATFAGSGGGSLVDSSQHLAFIKGLRDAVQTAKKLDCQRLLITVGNEVPGTSRAQQHKNIVEGLIEGAEIAEEAGILLLLEPLNVLVDHKGYYLSTSEEGFQILDEVGSRSVKLLYDIYHQQITEGNLIATIEKNIDTIGHFHVADVPGRREPGTGEINYANVFRAIDELGYDGYVGLEYRPSKAPEETLKEIKEMVK